MMNTLSSTSVITLTEAFALENSPDPSIVQSRHRYKIIVGKHSE